MADTTNDSIVSATTWVSAFTLSGVASTASLSIFNKSSYPVLMQIIAAQPADADVNGIIIGQMNTSYANATTEANASGVWLKAVNFPATINISEA
jgi:hypothetical protein